MTKIGSDMMKTLGHCSLYLSCSACCCWCMNRVNLSRQSPIRIWYEHTPMLKRLSRTLQTIDEEVATISDVLRINRHRIPYEQERVDMMFPMVAGAVQTLSRPALLSQCDAFGQFDPANEGEGQNRDIVPICRGVGETASWTAAPAESQTRIWTREPTLGSTREPTIISTAAPGL